MAHGHRLASRDSVSILDLTQPRAADVDAQGAAVLGRLVGGQPPAPTPASRSWGPENDNVEEMLEQVAEGAAVCIVPQSMTAFYARPDLAWVPIRDVDPLRIALGWRASDESPLLHAFADVVRELVDESSQPAAP
jgi:DNA-binding transcriptional LysR family regulator